MRELVAASVSPATRRAYQGQVRRLYAWLDDRCLTDETLAGYLAHLHDAGNSPASCSQVLAAVRFASKIAGCDAPYGPATQRVLAGIRRAGRERGRGQARGISWSEADRMAEIAAQSLASAGAELVEMQIVGRWKSPGMPARYARAEIAGRSAVARLRCGK